MAGKQIKVKAKLEVTVLCPPPTLKIIQGREYKMKFKPFQVAGKLTLANKDYKNLTPAKFPDVFKNAMRRELAIFHVRAHQGLQQIEKAKSGRDRSKFKKALKVSLEQSAKRIHKAAPDVFKELQEIVGKEGGGTSLPKDAKKNLKGMDKSLGAMKDDVGALTTGFASAHKELSRDPNMPKQEKVKHLKPLKGLIGAVEKSQKSMLADLKKTRGMTKDIDPRSADSKAKKLAKNGKAMDEAAKKFAAHAKSTERRSATVLAKLANNEYASSDAVISELSDIYEPRVLKQLGESYEDVADDAKKLKKAA